ncbi:hypothetical protein ACFCYN_03730 [Gottfriedia sp. NPDC056225]|uniref:hypothetical protein n=1 Tax=Gottfriedia sp. NPDC056225 TaxID=3345751 RepID=UPI0035DA2B2A
MWDIILGAMSIVAGFICIVAGIFLIVMAIRFSISDFKEAKSAKKKWSVVHNSIFNDFWGLVYGLVFGLGFTMIAYGFHNLLY